MRELGLDLDLVQNSPPAHALPPATFHIMLENGGALLTETSAQLTQE
jgi:hypothetical protein